MPYQSRRQQRFIRARASEGTPWARKFVADSEDEIHKGALMTTQTRYGNGGTSGRRLALPTEPVDKAFGLPGLGALKTSAKTVGYRPTAMAAGSMLKPKVASGLKTITATPTRTAATIGTTAVGANLMGRSSGRKQTYSPYAKAYEPENRRQRRLGAYEAGLGLTGGYTGFKGAKGAVETTRARHAITGVMGRKDAPGSVASVHDTIKGKSLLIRRKNAAQLAGGALLLGGAGLVRQHAEGKRGRAWN